jgi:hypothetical protein
MPTFRHCALILASAALALGASACGSSSRPASTAPSTAAPSGSGATTPVTNRGPATTTAPTAGAKTGHLGDTLSVTDVGGDTATVTFVKMIDPATSTSAAVPTADPGYRWVAFQATLVDNGMNAGDDSAAALATGSDGKQYAINTNIAAQVSGCTQNTSDAKPNESATFCPGFMIPTGVTLTQVGYSVAGSDVGVPSALTWSIP